MLIFLFRKMKDMFNSKTGLGLLNPFNQLLILVSLAFSSRKSQNKHFKKQASHLRRM